MKTLKFAAFLSVLVLPMSFPALGKTTENGLEVVGPRQKTGSHANNPRKVKSLQPALEWKAHFANEVTYDVVIYKAVGSFKNRVRLWDAGPRVYYREGLSDTVHQVEEPLVPGTQYLWTVRSRVNNEISEWSSFTVRKKYMGMTTLQLTDLFFLFQTPEAKKEPDTSSGWPPY